MKQSAAMFAEIVRKKDAEIERLRAALEAIFAMTDEEIAVRFRTSSHKTEEQIAGKSVISDDLEVTNGRHGGGS